MNLDDEMGMSSLDDLSSALHHTQLGSLDIELDDVRIPPNLGRVPVERHDRPWRIVTVRDLCLNEIDVASERWIRGKCSTDRRAPSRLALERNDAPTGSLGQHECVVSELTADIECGVSRTAQTSQPTVELELVQTEQQPLVMLAPIDP